MIQISPYHPEIEAIWRAIADTGAHSIAVVAADPNEGTTLIAGAIARRAGLARSREATDKASAANGPALLVDLNTSNASVGRLLGLRPEPGEIVRLDALGIAVLSRLDAQGADLLRERGHLIEWLSAWRREFGAVVLDTEHLLSKRADGISGVTAASVADATVLVTLAGRTPASRVREARARLQSAGARLIGAVLNDRDNPPLLAELERETWRLNRILPNSMAALRARMRRSTTLNVRI